MDKCFHVSSSMVSSTSARASVLHYSHHHSFPFSAQDKKVTNYLPGSSKSNKWTAAVVSFSSSRSRNMRRPALSIVCKASVDTGPSLSYLFFVEHKDLFYSWIPLCIVLGYKKVNNCLRLKIAMSLVCPQY